MATSNKTSKEVSPIIKEKVTKLNPLFIKKIETLDKKSNELNQIFNTIGRLSLEIELQKGVAAQTNQSILSEQESLKKELEAEYGNFKFGENPGEIIVIK